MNQELEQTITLKNFNLSVGDLFTQEAYDVIFLIKKLNHTL